MKRVVFLFDKHTFLPITTGKVGKVVQNISTIWKYSLHVYLKNPKIRF